MYLLCFFKAEVTHVGAQLEVGAAALDDLLVGVVQVTVLEEKRARVRTCLGVRGIQTIRTRIFSESVKGRSRLNGRLESAAPPKCCGNLSDAHRCLMT